MTRASAERGSGRPGRVLGGPHHRRSESGRDLRVSLPPVTRVHTPLPVDDVLGAVVDHLRHAPNLVLVAPPGAGKTTRLPQALADGGILPAGHAVLVLEPRRLAARLAARRIASERGVRLGGEVGYQVRFDDRTSRETRIALLTEGILTRRIQSDPLLEGVGAVVLDELHERSIHADLALAFLREIQETVRPDLRIIAMSATLDPGPVASFLGGAPVVRSAGRVFPVEVEWLEAPDERPIPERVASGVRRMLRTDPRAGNVLAFLPGASEIRRAAELLAPLAGEGLDVLPLYGELSADAQDRAVDPSPRRKVVLATNIAESSLTIEGVTSVVDAGYARVLRHDPALGIDRLELSRIGRSSADQRTGRAGRTSPGRALRLWTENEDRLLPAAEVPEIARVELSSAVLEVVRWSRRDPRAFGWFEAPPEASIQRAVGLLELFGAIERAGDGGHVLTELGERLAAIPAHPRVAMVLDSARRRGVVEEGALAAAIVSERDLLARGGYGERGDRVAASDVLHRLELFEELERAGFHAGAASRLGVDLGAAKAVREARDRLLSLAERTRDRRDGRGAKGRGEVVDREEALLRAVLAGYPDRVARRRVRGEDRVAFAGGGGARLARSSVVKESELLVAIDADGGARGQKDAALIRVASHVERSWLEEDTRGVVEERGLRFNPAREVVESFLAVRYGELVLEERPVPARDEEAVARVLAEAAREALDRALVRDDRAEQLLLRLVTLRTAYPEAELPFEDPDPRAVLAGLLPELARGRRSFAELRAIDLASELYARLPGGLARALDRDVPERLVIPSGRQAPLRYEVKGPPVLSVRLQEVFGMTATPRIAGGRIAVKMELLAPNHRPVQVTQDLASFWATTYAEVRNELRRRYPKHQWPEDPRDGDPTKRPGRR